MMMGEKGENLPPEGGRDWVRADEAARMVGLSREYFVVLARKEGFARMRGRTRRDFCWYVRSEVASWADFRRLRRGWYAKHSRSAKEKRWTEKIDLEMARRLFIPTEEAARLLGVVCSTVRGLVRRGRLLCYQSEPGRRGSRLWFSRRAVLQLKEDATHLKGQAARKRGIEDYAGHGRYGVIEAGTVRGIPADWLTTREAATRLGVHPSRVRELRETGRLRGERMWRHGKPLRFWYFPVSEVERLLADESYLAVRARWRARQEKRRAAEMETLPVTERREREDVWGLAGGSLFSEVRGTRGPRWACDESAL